MNTIIESKDAPKPIGPYSQAILVNGFLYVSGQIAINPKTDEIEKDDITLETHQVMNNLKAVLAQANMDFSDVVKATIFITDMNNFTLINQVYSKYFNGMFPARETVQVSALPALVNVEISVVAYKAP
jgi:2-iminobutanoate/2-iminopropanoate deaminase